MLLGRLKGLAVLLALAGALTLAWGWQAWSQTPPRDRTGEKADAQQSDRGRPQAGPTLPAVQEPRLRIAIQTPGGFVTSLAFSPDGRTLTSLGREGPVWTVTTWDPATGKGRLLGEYGHPIYSLTCSSDGKAMAWGCADRAIKVWDVVAGREKANLLERSVTSLAFSPDGKELASAHNDGTLRARDLATAKEWVLQQHGRRVFSLTYCADGKVLAWGCDDGTLKVWDVVAGKETGNFKDQRVSLVRCSPDGKTLATAAGRGGESVRLLDSATGKELAALDMKGDQVNCLAYTPDGKILAAGGNVGTVLLWDVAAGKKLATLDGQTGGVFSLAVSPDGKTLAVGGPDRAIRLWDLPTR
jgi:WD40 repeat protein